LLVINSGLCILLRCNLFLTTCPLSVSVLTLCWVLSLACPACQLLLVAQLTRELAGGYTVQVLKVNDIVVLGGAKLPADAIIAFFASPPSSVVLPNAQAPSSYSYLDIFLGGCKGRVCIPFSEKLGIHDLTQQHFFRDAFVSAVAAEP